MTDPMADDAVSDADPADEPTPTEQPEETHPRGTLLITSLFLVALIVTWVAMYFMMLSRS